MNAEPGVEVVAPIARTSPKGPVHGRSASGPVPRLTFYPTADEQPKRDDEGIPALQSHGTKLELRVVEEAGRAGQEGAVPGGLVEHAYEARIGPLSSGKYTLILRDDGYRFSLKPLLLHYVANVAAN